ncbi:DUF3126 family protein [Cohaesibacter sp. CAU 1516]|uniref:DUF3126 family protein n=1 Tax=Cohaesibacter sp. CAU 1516 TaxID=2576038 RepID=UPI0010FD6607|nr:DUF3126 family protein [Cohaesibacter sp. CAU 1516]TLP48634.1 DUF3126 family protein [Cohaesibacter sp. CAU 1516]
MEKTELAKVQKFMRATLQSPSLEVRVRPRKDDSAEVYVEDEFVGVLFRDEEDGDLSYNFSMAILEFDLDED